MQASGETRGGVVYLGKDILGSVRSVSNETGTLESRYEYDAFGTPYTGDFSSGMNLGYTGKPYDSATGLYDYGYRDYKPEVARFTTVDPIRDGNNWFAYVNNDPVNYVDPWGLSPSDKSASIVSIEVQPPVVIERQTAININAPNPEDRYHCDVMAWNGAADAGYDPRAQNGETWDGNKMTVSEIYGLYPNNRTSTPVDNTAGYEFSNFNKQGQPGHIQFYNKTGDTFIVNQTDGRKDPPTPKVVETNPTDRVYVPLNPIK
jgi:RHS repeat-associated protein